ncbi:MAG: RagB/SusD family nutrient uptake outer membrane protein [Gemmatimonadaceae bacterium]
MKMISKRPVYLGMAVMLCSVSTLYGCKDFLTDAALPQGTLDAGTLGNKAGVEGSLIAAYRQLDYSNGVGGGWGSAASNWIWASVASDDAYKGSSASDQPGITAVENYAWSAPDAQGDLNDKWRAVYEGVSRSNATISLLKAVIAAKPAELAAVDQKGIEGEATFLRAHYHFEAWKMWGNIPYYRETDTDFRKPNTTQALAIDEIIKDLDAAIALLPATPRNGNAGRATSWTAKAYKGRVQMFKKDYAGALGTLNNVITSGPYALESSYDKVWTGISANENGKETIFAYQASANDGEPNGNNANFGERLNFPNGGSSSPGGCCGFHQPSQNLVNYFGTDAAGLPVALGNTATWNVNNADVDSSWAGNVDPRLDWTAGRNGVPYKDWGKQNPTWIREVSNGGFYEAKKNAAEKSSGAISTVGWQNTQLNSVNIHLLRYADVLLLAAEAEVEAGSLPKAMALVNQVRARAKVKVQGPGTTAVNMAVDITDPSITWANYKVEQYAAGSPFFATQAAAREAVRAERRVELALEGQRFFDLRRWGLVPTAIPAYINGVGGGAEKTRRLYLSTAAAVTGTHNLYPIPTVQIDLSKSATGGGLTQNPGW